MSKPAAEAHVPEISFIVPCYNYGRYLPECLAAIFAQAGDWDVEVLVIDDASTDDSWAVAERYADRARVMRNDKNLGHAATLTRGLHAVRGRYVARIDPDDRLKPRFLSETVPILRRHPEVGLVYGDVCLIDENGRETQATCDRIHGGADFKGNEFTRLLAHNFICAPSVLARREAWLEALPIPEDLAFNDWHFTTMMARRHEFYYVAKVLAEYRVHGANLHAAIARSGREEESVLRVLRRYYDETEASPQLEREKRARRDDIYAAQYADFARKYFGSGQYAHVRRCYLAAARHRPSTLASPEVLRHLFATLVGRRAYERLKSVARRALA
jgi:glycosyltransferase involved in cell wall biosynthesis